MTSSQQQKNEKHQEALSFCCAISDNNTKIISGEVSGNLRIWDLNENSCHLISKAHGESAVTCCSVFAGDKKFISGSNDKTLKIWDLEDLDSRDPVRILKGHGCIINCCAVFVMDSKNFAISGDDNGILNIWDLDTGILHKTYIDNDKDPILCCAAYPRSSKFVSGGYSGLKLWDRNEEKYEKKCKDNIDSTCVCVATFVAEHSFNAISGTAEGTLNIWDLSNQSCRSLWSPQEEEGSKNKAITFCGVLENGRGAIGGRIDGTIKIWELVTLTPIRTMSSSKGSLVPRFCAFFDDGKKAISSNSVNSTLMLWDLSSGKTYKTLKASNEPHDNENGTMILSSSSLGVYSNQTSVNINCRVMIVGDPGTGKSCCCRGLIGNPDKEERLSESTNLVETFNCRVYEAPDGYKWEEGHGKSNMWLESHVARKAKIKAKENESANAPRDGARNSTLQLISDFIQLFTTPDQSSETSTLSVLNEESLGHDNRFEAMEKLRKSNGQSVVKLSVDEQDIIACDNYVDVIKCTFYDCGGDHQFDSLHPVFFTSLATYIVVFNVYNLNCEHESSGELAKIDSWIERVMTYTIHDKNSIMPSILLVGTHLDKLATTLDEDENLQDVETKINDKISELLDNMHRRTQINIKKALVTPCSSEADTKKFFFSVT